MSSIKSVIVAGLMVAMIVPPTHCYPQSQFPQVEQSEPPAVENEWFQPERPAIENQDRAEFEEDGNEDVFELEEAGIEGSACATELYVIAFTSGQKKAGSDDSPHLSVKLTTGEKKDRRLYNRPGNDMLKNKGDLWELKISSFRFRTVKCIRRSDIKEIVVHNGGTDGWNIESILTILHSANTFQIVTANMHVNRWVDRNRGVQYRQYVLTNV